MALSTRSRLAVFTLTILSLFFRGEPLKAVDGRDFAGYYDVTGVTDLGDRVSLWFRVVITNYSGQDVASANLELRSSTPENGEKVWAAFPVISVQDGGTFRRREWVTVPKLEYQEWQGGKRPRLIVTFRDRDNREISRTAEVAQGVIPDEE